MRKNVKLPEMSKFNNSWTLSVASTVNTHIQPYVINFFERNAWSGNEVESFGWIG